MTAIDISQLLLLLKRVQINGVKDLGGTTIAEAIVESLANNNFDLVLEGKSLRTSLTLPDSK